MLYRGYGIPEIYEDEVNGNLVNIYRDIQFVLKVPIVNFVFRTLAYYETFLGTAWGQIRLNMLTHEMEYAAEQLRYPRISLNVIKENWKDIYDLAAINQIKRVILTFNYVNPKLLLIASAWAESLGNRPIQGSQNNSGFITPGIILGLPEIHLVELNNTTPNVRSLLEDIIQKHHAYDAASEYRALANYPEFLQESWKHLKPYVGSDEYNLLKEKLKTKAIRLVHEQMTFPIRLNPDFLYPFYHPRDVSGIMGIVSMFQNVLPGLIIEGEFFRRMIG